MCKTASLVGQEFWNRARARLKTRVAVLEREQAALRALRPAGPMPEEYRAGKRPLLRPEAITRVLAFLDARLAGLDRDLATVAAESRDLEEKHGVARSALSRFDARALQAGTIQVVALITAGQDPGGRSITLTLEYFVPGPSWQPVYALEVGPGGDRATLRTAGLVRQTSGEDWPEVELSLSTSIPGQSIELPEMLTWTLGESRDFLPVTRSASPAPPGRLAAPVARISETEVEATAQLAELRQKLSALASAVTSVPPPPRPPVSAAAAPPPPPSPSPPPSPVLVSGVKRETQYDFEDDVVEGSFIRPEGECIIPQDS